jgi:glycosyltransferase involved in cell wall biosynthesis
MIPSRVVYFTDSEAMGGAEQALITLMSRLDTRRWEPVLLHHGGEGVSPLVDQVRRLGVTEIEVPRAARLRSVWPIARLVRGLRKLRPSVFHANLNRPESCRTALLAATVARVPSIVATQHFFGEGQSQPARRRHRLAVSGVDSFIAVSRDTATRLSTWLHEGTPRVVVIHNGIPLEPFERSALGESLHHVRKACGRGVVLAVGRLVRRKGFHDLLAAAALLPDIQVLVAGDGPERGALEAQANELGLSGRVEFLGERKDVPDLLEACDVFVLPSRFEGHPLAALEAMAAGRPVVATDSGGTREAVLHGETGLLVPPGDAVALAHAITELLHDRVHARCMGEAGRARARREFGAPLMAERVMRLYDELRDRDAARRQ